MLWLQSSSLWQSVFLCSLGSGAALSSPCSWWVPAWDIWWQDFTFPGSLIFLQYCLPWALQQVLTYLIRSQMKQKIPYFCFCVASAHDNHNLNLSRCCRYFRDWSVNCVLGGRWFLLLLWAPRQFACIVGDSDAMSKIWRALYIFSLSLPASLNHFRQLQSHSRYDSSSLAELYACSYIAVARAKDLSEASDLKVMIVVNIIICLQAWMWQLPGHR